MLEAEKKKKETFVSQKKPICEKWQRPFNLREKEGKTNMNYAGENVEIIFQQRKSRRAHIFSWTWLDDDIQW